MIIWKPWLREEKKNIIIFMWIKWFFFEQNWIPFTQGCFVPSLVEIGQWFWRRSQKWKKLTDGWTDRQTTDERRSVKLTWPFSSGELKTFLSKCILNWVSIYTCLQANKYVNWMIDWINKNQYLSWMLNKNYCVPDEKYFRKQVYIIHFSCM